MALHSNTVNDTIIIDTKQMRNTPNRQRNQLNQTRNDYVSKCVNCVKKEIGEAFVWSSGKSESFLSGSSVDMAAIVVYRASVMVRVKSMRVCRYVDILAKIAD